MVPSFLAALAAAATVLAALGSAPAAAQPASGCAPAAVSCARSGPMAVGITQFRAGNQGAAHWAQANVTLSNRGREPLTLAYVDRSAHPLDEHGNRYEVPHGGVRGIGVADRRSVDTSFVLAPGDSADTRVEFQWTRGLQALTGLRFEMSLALREVSPQPGGQVRLGREHLLRWVGLSDDAAAAAAAPAAVATAVQAAAAVPGAPAGDPCGGRVGCVATGGFVTELVRVSPPAKTSYANELLVTPGFRVTNHGRAPLVLGFLADSGQMIDERGERYKVTYVYRDRVAGIGQVRRNSSIDPQFVLGPGESRPFTLGYSRTGAPNGARSYSADLVLTQLELLPGNQVRIVREHALNFPQVSAAAVAAGAGASPGAAPAGAAELVEAVQGLRELFREKN